MLPLTARSLAVFVWRWCHELFQISEENLRHSLSPVVVVVVFAHPLAPCAAMSLFGTPTRDRLRRHPAAASALLVRLLLPRTRDKNSSSWQRVVLSDTAEDNRRRFSPFLPLSSTAVSLLFSFCCFWLLEKKEASFCYHFLQSRLLSLELLSPPTLSRCALRRRQRVMK